MSKNHTNDELAESNTLLAMQKVHFAVFEGLASNQKVHFAVFEGLASNQKAHFAVFEGLASNQKARVAAERRWTTLMGIRRCAK